MKAWLDAAGITTGPLFRSVKKAGAVGERLPAQSVADIVKTYAQRVGLDPTLFAGLSVRSGFLTSAATCQLTPAQSPPKADSSSNGDVSPTPEAPPSYPLRFHSASLGRLSGDGTRERPKSLSWEPTVGAGV